MTSIYIFRIQYIYKDKFIYINYKIIHVLYHRHSTNTEASRELHKIYSTMFINKLNQI